MSISDMIIVMKFGVIQQIGKPQEVYDDPVNLFVAKFLGTPPINVFTGTVKGEKLYIDGSQVLDVPGVSDQEVYVGIRPEGFILHDQGPFQVRFGAVEVMGRDISIVSYSDASENPTIRSIIDSSNKVEPEDGIIRFALKPEKVHLFSRETEERIRIRRDR